MFTIEEKKDMIDDALVTMNREQREEWLQDIGGNVYEVTDKKVNYIFRQMVAYDVIDLSDIMETWYVPGDWD